MNRRRPLTLLSVALLATAVSLAGGLAGCQREAGAPQAGFNGVDISGADFANALTLPDTQGKPRSIADFKGKVVAVFFGYTQCPDVCPTTMADLAQLKKSMGKDGERLQAVFVTIDPERDTAPVLQAYVGSFDPSFVALRGSVEQTQQVAKAFKVYFAKVPGKTEGSYTMDHTAGTYLIDPAGKVRLFERYGVGGEPLAADIRALLSSSG